jgi:UDP-N-acetylglucosamine acyltransferase
MCAMIHSSAIVAAEAQLDDTACVEPYAIIGPQVKIAAGTKIGAHSLITGNTTIGRDCTIAAFVSLGGAPQDMKYRGEPTRLEIGERNTIREFTTIHTGTVQDAGVTRVGNDNWIMAYVHIAHDCQIGNHTIFGNNAQIAGHVHVGDWAVLGGMSAVHQFVCIGAHAMLGAASAIMQDIPPFVMAAGHRAVPRGINTEGLKRRGFDKVTTAALKKAYCLLYKSGYSFASAKEELQKLLEQEGDAIRLHLQTFLDFISVSSIRGLAR